MAKDPMLERIVAKQLGDQPAAEAQAAPQKKPEPSEKPTVQEQAAKEASPKTEGDKQQEEAIMYAVKMGDQTRQLTPQQIAGTFERYKDLNYKNQVMAPVNKLVESLMNPSNGKKYSPEQVAKFLEAGAKAMTKNTQMGRERRDPEAGVASGRPPSQPSSMQRNMQEEFAKYEDENAITLPPGYREAAERMNRMEQQIQAQTVAMQSMMQGAQGAAQMGQQAASNAQTDRAASIRQTIANNLNAAQQANGLADSDAKAFMAYAGERGYTAEDFADKGLTEKVVADFKNNRNSPEFDRLQEMAKRRQSYLTSNAPSGGGANAPKATRKSASEAQFDRLADRAMKNRIG